MRAGLLLICLVLSARLLADETELGNAVKEYQAIQKKIDAALSARVTTCAPNPNKAELVPKTFCSIGDFCKRDDFHIDGPFLYENSAGEKISNDDFMTAQKSVVACLKEKYSDDIKQKRDDLATKLKVEHLKKVIALNSKLSALIKQHSQGAALQKVSSQILTMSLEDDEDVAGSSTPSLWDSKYAPKRGLESYLKLAEKRAGVQLNPEIKKALIEMQYLKLNPLYEEEVDKMEAHLFPIQKSTDPLYNWDLLRDQEEAGGKKNLDKNRAYLTAKTSEAFALFKETQKEILAYLETKKTETNLDKIERIIERLKSIRFELPRLTKTLESECKIPNAYYSKSEHSFTICPQMLTFPKMALMETMAHEMTHSFDPCYLSAKLIKSKSPRVVEDAPFEIDLKLNDNDQNFKVILDDTPNGAGLKNIVQERMLYKDNPFTKTLSCLQDQSSVGAIPMDTNSIAQKIKNKQMKMIRLGQDNSQNNDYKFVDFSSKNQQEFLDYFQGCNIEGDIRTQLQEAFADKVAAEIMAKKLSQLSVKDAATSINEIILSYGNLCSSQGLGEREYYNFGVKQDCPDYFENVTTQERILTSLKIVNKFDPHPDPVIRIQNNLLAHPLIRKSLNCETAKGVKFCE